MQKKNTTCTQCRINLGHAWKAEAHSDGQSKKWNAHTRANQMQKPEGRLLNRLMKNRHSEESGHRKLTMLQEDRTFSSFYNSTIRAGVDNYMGPWATCGVLMRCCGPSQHQPHITPLQVNIFSQAPAPVCRALAPGPRKVTGSWSWRPTGAARLKLLAHPPGMAWQNTVQWGGEAALSGLFLVWLQPAGAALPLPTPHSSSSSHSCCPMLHHSQQAHWVWLQILAAFQEKETMSWIQSHMHYSRSHLAETACSLWHGAVWQGQDQK